MKTFKELNEEFKELNYGAFSTAYTTSHSNKEVIKKSKNKQYSIKEILVNRLMSKRPDLFAKITVNRDDMVSMEKLDDRKFHIKLSKAMGYLMSKMDNDSDYEVELTDASYYTDVYNQCQDLDESMFKIIKADKLYSGVPLVVREFLELRLNIYKYFKPYLIGGEKVVGGLQLDSNINNYGYDGNNKIKCFDPCFLDK